MLPSFATSDDSTFIDGSFVASGFDKRFVFSLIFFSTNDNLEPKLATYNLNEAI